MDKLWHFPLTGLGHAHELTNERRYIIKTTEKSIMITDVNEERKEELRQKQIKDTEELPFEVNNDNH